MTTIQEKLEQICPTWEAKRKVEQIIIFGDPERVTYPEHQEPEHSWSLAERILNPKKTIQIISEIVGVQDLNLSKFYNLTSLIVDGGYWNCSCWRDSYWPTFDKIILQYCPKLESIDLTGFYVKELDLRYNEALKSINLSAIVFGSHALKLGEYDELYNFSVEKPNQSYILFMANKKESMEKITQLQEFARERRKGFSYHLRLNQQLKQNLEQKEQENQNYLVRIRELEEQNALLQQELATERGTQEITTNLENQSLEGNSERQLGIELTTQIVQIRLIK